MNLEDFEVVGELDFVCAQIALTRLYLARVGRSKHFGQKPLPNGQKHAIIHGQSGTATYSPQMTTTNNALLVINLTTASWVRSRTHFSGDSVGM